MTGAWRYYERTLNNDVLAALDEISSVNVWYRVKFYTPNLQSFDAADVLDIAHATGKRSTNSFRGTIIARFDTVLVETKGNGIAGIGGLKDIRVARLRAIITVPRHLQHRLFGQNPPEQLAIVEWFTSPTRRDRDSNLYRVSRDPHNTFGVVEAKNLRRSCHLFPEFGRSDVDLQLNPFTVLDTYDKFFLNDIIDGDAYRSMY